MMSVKNCACHTFRSEQLEVAEALGVELHEYKDRGHFQGREFPELLQAIHEKINIVTIPCIP